MISALRDKSQIERQIDQAENIIAETARLIDEQVLLIASKLGHAAATDAEHTLDIVMKLQATHISYRDGPRAGAQILEAPAIPDVVPRDGGKGQRQT